MKLFLEIVFGLVVIAIAVFLMSFVWRPLPAANSIATTGGQVTSTTQGQMRFEVVTTPAAQELGLGNRAEIPDNYGMLFVFPKADRYGFWMKDMLASIDIVWLADDGTIVLIDHSVDPATYPHVFYPPQPVRYVVDTRAGYAHEHGWDVGTKVPLPSPYSGS